MKDISIPKKGMVKDLDDLNLSVDSYSHALNAVQENSTGDGFFLQNDYSNVLGAVIKDDVIGKLFLPELNKTLLFTVGNQIIELNPLNYSDNKLNAASTLDGSFPLVPSNEVPIYSSKILAESPCFNWSINDKLRLEYKITDSTLNIYFGDGNNEDRYIYFNLNNNMVFRKS